MGQGWDISTECGLLERKLFVNRHMGLLWLRWERGYLIKQLVVADQHIQWQPSVSEFVCEVMYY